jgi:hypothetical protein
MGGVYIIIIIIGTIWGACYLLEPVYTCYYKCFPRKREQIIEV